MDIGTIVPADFPWPEPWEKVSQEDAARLERELRSELPNGHVLEAKQCVAISRSSRSDDVMFGTDDADRPVAVVHLTWKGSVEFHPSFPSTELYSSVERAISEWESA
jgi:hypothetical protein